MTTETKFFPNIPVMHWNNLRAQFKRSIPGTISSNYLATVLDMTETSAKANILPSLRQIGLLDNEGKINQDLAKKFRDDDLYPKFCDEIVKKIYPQGLRDAFPDKDLNRDRIKKWFMNHTSVGNSAASRIVAFYVALVEADPNPTTTTNSTKIKDVKSKLAKAQTKPKIKINQEEKLEQKSPPTGSGHKQSSGPDLNINIQIHISSDASSDQIKSIFENMAKYVYKNQVND
ncbi:MAG TPA: DUF5343 domain-containing protein [Chitinophagaceae bacterium]|nr:DUF5343 domain-containing protein [Chitinophagaceae bacterium]